MFSEDVILNTNRGSGNRENSLQALEAAANPLQCIRPGHAEVRQSTKVSGLVSSVTVTVKRRSKPWQGQHCQSNEAHVDRAWGGISEDQRPERLREETYPGLGANAGWVLEVH